MKELKTLSEHDILRAAWSELYGRLERERAHLERNPGNCISLARIEKLTAQTNEIHARIINADEATKAEIAELIK